MALSAKTRNILGWVLSAPPVLAVAFGAFNKLSGNEEVVGILTDLNIDPIVLGLLAVLCVVLYLVPVTANLGFFMLCSYYGGVIVGELAMGEFPLVGILMSVLLYVGTLLRKPELSGWGI